MLNIQRKSKLKIEKKNKNLLRSKSKWSSKRVAKEMSRYPITYSSSRKERTWITNSEVKINRIKRMQLIGFTVNVRLSHLYWTFILLKTANLMIVELIIPLVESCSVDKLTRCVYFCLLLLLLFFFFSKMYMTHSNCAK